MALAQLSTSKIAKTAQSQKHVGKLAGIVEMMAFE